MGISWKEIWDRYFYFKSSNKSEPPPSITSQLDEPRPQEYDINFLNATHSMLSDDAMVSGSFGGTGVDYMSWISGAEQSKDNRIKMYREMEQNAWVDDGLSEYVSAALNEDSKGNTINLKIKNEDLSNNNNIRDNLNKEFEHIIKSVFNYNLVFGEWFREFCLTGECAVELLVPLDNVLIRTEGVVNVKLLRSEQYVAYHDTNGNLEGFVVRNPYDRNVRVLASKDQIAYVDSGVYDYIAGIGLGWAQQYIPSPERILRIPRSFVDAAKKPYKQLDALEDSVVIYRMCLTGDTRILIPNNRYKYIKDVEIGDIVLTYDLKEKQFVTSAVTNKWLTGIKKTYTVTTEHTEITGTSTHPIYVYNRNTEEESFVPISDLNSEIHMVKNYTRTNEGVDIEFPEIRSFVCSLSNNRVWIESDIERKEKRIEEASDNTGLPINKIRNFLYGQQTIPVEEFKILREELDVLKDQEVDVKYEGNWSNDVSLPKFVDEDFARLFGFLIGDGSISSNGIAFTEGVYPEQNEFYCELLTKFFGNCKRYHTNRKYGNYYTCSVLGIELIQKMGYIQGAYNKRIPEWAFQAKPEIRKAFVEGLMDADGCNKHIASARAWEISLCNKQLIEDLKELWSSLGYTSRKIRTRTRKAEFRAIGDQDKPQWMPETTSWELYLSEIPVKEFERIKSINESICQEVYDIEVNHESHNFVANNILVHNSRAPERLVFNVATGNLPKSKAEQYLQKLVNKFRKKLTYNSTTGEIDQGQNVKNIMEDFWFAKDQSGKGTDVTTLSGATNLGEMEDVNYFLGKLWKAMKIPPTRMSGEQTFDQNPGSISTTEIKFQKYIYFILMRFALLVKSIYTQHLKIKGIWQHYNLSEEDIEIIPVPPSYFTYMKNAEFLEAQFARFANFSNNIDSETPIFSKKTALKEGLGWSDEQIAQNEAWLKEETDAKNNKEEQVGDELGGGEEPSIAGDDGGLDL